MRRWWPVLAKNRLLHFSVMAALLAPIALRDRPTSARITRAGAWPSAIARATTARVRFAIWFVEKDRPFAARDAADIARAVASVGPSGARGMGDRSPVPDTIAWTEDGLARAAGHDVARAGFRADIGQVVGPVAAAWGFYVLVPLGRSAP